MNILVDSTPFSPPPPNRGGLKGLINPSNLVDCNISCCVLKTELIDVFSCPPFFFFLPYCFKNFILSAQEIIKQQ